MKIVHAAAIGLLGFLGITAIVGAVPLILYPQGDLMHMPLSMLQHSPFHSFLIPGIILLLVNGILSFIVLNQTLRRRKGYGWWVASQGCVLSGWIIIQVIMIQGISWLHFLYLAVGLMLIASGFAIIREARSEKLGSQG